MAETFRFYDEADGWIECETDSGCMYLSAHVYNNGKYSKAMLRKYIHFQEAVGVIRTELRYNYLVEWFSKHYNVINISDDLYEIRSM